MHKATVNVVVLAALVGACGDSGGNTATDSATASGTGTATTGGTMVTPTSSSSDSQTGSSGGSNSDSDTDATSTGPTTGGTTTSDTTGDTTTGSTGGVSTGETTEGTSTSTTGTTDPGTSTGVLPCGEPGEPDVSYIWVANSTQGTISKINTQTLVEEGRYIVRPDQQGSPSRTSVSLTGDVAVANRSGGLTKVYARPESCAESNGMPGIQTSNNSNYLPWGVEECIAWYTPMAYVSQRPVAWTQGTFNQNSCKWENQKLWTSGASDGQGVIGVDVMLIDGATGVIEAQKNIPEIVPSYFGMYGAAVDKDGNMWASQLGQGTLLFVDIDTMDHKTWPMATSGYGMTVGASGYVWTCSSSIGRFDPMSETWQTAFVSGSGGCMEDDNGTLYVSGGANNIVAVDVQTMAVKATYPLPEYVHGISVDYYGYVWGVGMTTSAYRVDVVNNGAFQAVTGLVNPYTYSDMTGVALSNVSPQ